MKRFLLNALMIILIFSIGGSLAAASNRHEDSGHSGIILNIEK